ncbi:hypothetical protein BEN47_12145 [Hymenobacter lapidarius]|uniref:Uncharacterized protein n=1 Tax=Hymenobacter lapidarius TaxID=1908237 RepID=A0A1G1T851_9BACT|nr:hypothetical protein [Hymenobacter lapidarius]OGX87053.1 hypothetical protein BEN47_12145 [Hymenobacter lapidarius]
MAAFYDTNRPLFVPAPLADIIGMLRTWGFDDRAVMDYHDKYGDFFDFLATAPVYDEDLTPDDFVPVNQRLFRTRVGARYAKDIIANSLGAGIIECDKLFYPERRNKAGEVIRPGKSLGYRFAPAFRGKLIALNFLKPEVLGRKLDLRTAAKRAERAARAEATGDQLLVRIEADVNRLRIHRDQALARNEAVYERTLAFLTEHRTLLARTTCPMEYYNYLLDLARNTDEAITLPARKDVAKRLKTARMKAEKLATPAAPTWYQAMEESITASHDRNLVTVEQLASGHFQDVTRPDPESRVFTMLTSLATESRANLYHVDYPGERLFNLDIRNCQPFLLNVLLKRRYADNGLPYPADVMRYRQQTAVGMFYEDTANAHGLSATAKRERKEFKGRMFGSVFFGETRHTEASQLGQWFMKNYPSVYALIWASKRHDYTQLAIKLQRIEAGLVVDTVLPALQAQGIWCASIHDSIICRERDVPVAMALLSQAFEAAAGIAPSIEAVPLDGN